MTADRQATLDAYRQQLDESYLKCKSLQDSNNKLQITLRDSQDELDRFVKQYETLSQALTNSDRDLSMLRKQNNEMRRDLDERNLSLGELREREMSREREL